jgi:hypothetical protein
MSDLLAQQFKWKWRDIIKTILNLCTKEISCCVVDCVVSGVSKDCGAFVLRIKQSRLL